MTFTTEQHEARRAINLAIEKVALIHTFDHLMWLVNDLASFTKHAPYNPLVIAEQMKQMIVERSLWLDEDGVLMSNINPHSSRR